MKLAVHPTSATLSPLLLQYWPAMGVDQGRNSAGVSKLPVTAGTFTLNNLIFVGVAFSVGVTNRQNVFHTGYDVCDISSLLDISAVPTNVLRQTKHYWDYFLQNCFHLCINGKIGVHMNTKVFECIQSRYMQVNFTNIIPFFQNPWFQLKVCSWKACTCVFVQSTS